MSEINNQIPEENSEEVEEEKSFAERVTESVNWVVDMMNEGRANPKEVYPPGRYHGD
jgi:hypothetical protein